MANELNDVLRSLRELANRSMDEQARLWRGYLELWKPRAEAAPAPAHDAPMPPPVAPAPEASTAPPPPPAAPEPSPPSTTWTSWSSSTSSTTESLRQLGDETARLLRDYAKLTARYYQGVFELGRGYAEVVAGQVLGVRTSSGSTTSPAAPAAPAPAAVDGAGALVLEATAGGVASASFIVENHRNQRLDVELQVSSFTGPGGAFDADVAIEPNGFALEPNEERRVTLSVKLAPERFAAAGRYRATLVNRRDPDTRLVVEVRALELVTGQA